MPRAFSDREEANIRDRLKKDGRRLFAAQGVLKTSIDQITKAAGIAKGSFYKFYGSKELLFFELLEETQNATRAPLVAGKPLSRKKTRRQFEQLMQTLFSQICSDPLIQYMGRESELLAISRKVPPEILTAHQKKDQRFLDDLIERWNTNAKRPRRDVVAARISVLMLISLKKEFLGPRLFDHAAAAAISSLADCFFRSTANT